MTDCGTGSLVSIRPPSSTGACGCECVLSDLTVSTSLDCIGTSAGANMSTVISAIDTKICDISSDTTLTNVSWCAPNATVPPATATLQETVDFIAEQFIPKSGNNCADCPVTDFIYFSDTKGIGGCAEGASNDNKVYFSGDFTYLDAVDQVRVLNDLKVSGGVGVSFKEITSTTDLSALQPTALGLTYNITPASNTTLTLPEIADANAFNPNRLLIVHHEGCDTTKTVTIEPYGGETIEGDANKLLPVGEAWVLHADGVNDWKIVGRKYSECSSSESGFVEGYVAFGDEYGWLRQDTVNPFFYDNTRGYLGVNTAAPSGYLHVQSPVTGKNVLYNGATLFINTTDTDEKVLQVKNNISALGCITMFVDTEKSGGFSVDKFDGTTVNKLRGAQDDHTYFNNTYVSVGRSGNSTSYGGTIDGAKFTVNDNTRDPYTALGDANNWQMMVQSSVDTGGSGAGIAFVNESATKDVNVGSAILHTKTGNNGKGDLAFYTKESTTDLVDPVQALYIADNQRVGVGSSYDYSSKTPTSTFEVDGSVSQKVQAVSADDTLGITDYFTAVDTSGADVTINLPAASGCKGRTYVIKKIAAGNTLTVDAAGADLIDGAAIYSVTNIYASITLISDGVSNWWKI
jgi:hypothetical protein